MTTEELLKEAVALMQTFVNRCEAGEIRSVKTKAAFKEFLDRIGPVKDGD